MIEDFEGTDMAFIVTLVDEAWFLNDGMIRYDNKHNTIGAGINDDANMMLLRADLHRSLPRKRALW